jgi:uncharacterized protein
MDGMKVAVSGASGLIGSALVPALRADGHAVLTLVRRPPRADGEVRWDPAGGLLDPVDLAGTDAVVHLAGAGVFDRRWTAAYRRTIRDSRVQGTRLLSGVLAGLAPRPRVLLSGSGVGWYGPRADEPVDESAPPGEGFLADVAREWEAATAAAEEAGIRVCRLRSGVVLSGRGGALGRQLPLFRLGVGGRLSSGRQWLSWISLVDEVAAIRFLLTAEDVGGPVNLVAPGTVTNAAFTRALAAAVHRPAAAPVPRLALRVALGGFADEGVLASQRVVPAALLRAGFTFAHPDIDTALRAVLTERM